VKGGGRKLDNSGGDTVSRSYLKGMTSESQGESMVEGEVSRKTFGKGVQHLRLLCWVGCAEKMAT